MSMDTEEIIVVGDEIIYLASQKGKWLRVLREIMRLIL